MTEKPGHLRGEYHQEHSPRVLIYEDDKDCGYFFTSFLKSNGIEVVYCSEIKAAFEEIGRMTFHGALIDVFDAKSNPSGINLKNQLNRLQPNIEVFLITGHSEFRDECTGEREHFLMKPLLREQQNMIIDRISQHFTEMTGVNPVRETNTTGILEAIHGMTLHISFCDPEFGWGMVDLAAPRMLNWRELILGTAVDLVVMHSGKQITGFRIKSFEAQSQDSGFSEIENFTPPKPEDFKDPLELKIYEQQLRKLYGE